MVQGLAYELAGIHYTKIDEPQTALDFFNQAKKCYLKWGSELKVDSINQKIEKIISTQDKSS